MAGFERRATMCPRGRWRSTAAGAYEETAVDVWCRRRSIRLGVGDGHAGQGLQAGDRRDARTSRPRRLAALAADAGWMGAQPAGSDHDEERGAASARVGMDAR